MIVQGKRSVEVQSSREVDMPAQLIYKNIKYERVRSGPARQMQEEALQRHRGAKRHTRQEQERRKEPEEPEEPEEQHRHINK